MALTVTTKEALDLHAIHAARQCFNQEPGHFSEAEACIDAITEYATRHSLPMVTVLHMWQSAFECELFNLYEQLDEMCQEEIY